MRTRLDSRGRRIGRNYWREYVCQTLQDADDAWLLAREAECVGWRTEEREHAARNPRPTLKATLIGLSQQRAREAAAA